MKKILIPAMCLTFCVASITQSYGQLSKVEKKEWKTKYKAYKKDLEAFKNLVEEHTALRGEVNNLNGQVSNLQSRISDKDAELGDLQTRVQQLEGDVASARSAQRKAEQDLATKPPSTSGDWDKGVVFRVQIGAFEKNKLEGSTGSDESTLEEGEGMQKVVLGNFRDYWEADKFKKYLRNMGVKDAWIVPYKDGTRVEIKEVLEGVVQ